jgi:hypothetical protein
VLVVEQLLGLLDRDPAALVDLVAGREPVVGEHAHRPPADGLRAALAVGVVLRGELRAELAAQPGLLVDLAQRGVAVRLARGQLALGQRPVLVVGPVDDADLALAQDDATGSLDAGGHVRARVLTEGDEVHPGGRWERRRRAANMRITGG